MKGHKGRKKVDEKLRSVKCPINYINNIKITTSGGEEEVRNKFLGMPGSGLYMK
jgi:hypothetical protein